MANLEIVIPARDRDLGGFHVHRVLPYAKHQMVGPFIFFDHMGPADFPAGKGIEVRPHPHINLATVTYLFKGRIHHRDSLGSDRIIEPGAINWMTAGHGIVHSERAVEEDLKAPSSLHGIQLWVALPQEFEEIAPAFSHHPKNTLPEFKINDVSLKLLLGKAFGYESPVPVHSDLFYAEAIIKKGQKFELKADGREHGFYVVEGKIQCENEILEPMSMAVSRTQEKVKIEALEDSIIMLLGGSPVGERHIDWNFVSSDLARIESAKLEWSNYGPREESSRFKPVPGDDRDFIPLKI